MRYTKNKAALLTTAPKRPSAATPRPPSEHSLLGMLYVVNVRLVRADTGEKLKHKKDQIEGSISTIEELCNENQYLEEMLSWAYGKLHGRNFINMEDALMADRINLWLKHRIAG